MIQQNGIYKIMKFKEYLTEMISIDKWETLKDKLDKDCQPFIKEFKGCTTLLYRGVKTPPSFCDKKTTRTNRKPRLLDIDLHDKLGKETKQRFGWNARTEGVFTTSNVFDVKRWGSPSIVFPIGKFKYIWNRNVKSLYGAYDQWSAYTSDNGITDHILKELWDYDITDALDWYKSTNLNKYLMVKSPTLSECIIKCKNYYSINYEWSDTLIEWYSKRMYK